MKEKLLDLMKREGLKPSQLAEMLGINPAGISHILKDRNKPSFDLLQEVSADQSRLAVTRLDADVSRRAYRNTAGTRTDVSDATSDRLRFIRVGWHR